MQHGCKCVACHNCCHVRQCPNRPDSTKMRAICTVHAESLRYWVRICPDWNFYQVFDPEDSRLGDCRQKICYNKSCPRCSKCRWWAGRSMGEERCPQEIPPGSAFCKDHQPWSDTMALERKNKLAKYYKDNPGEEPPTEEQTTMSSSNYEFLTRIVVEHPTWHLEHTPGASTEMFR